MKFSLIIGCIIMLTSTIVLSQIVEFNNLSDIQELLISSDRNKKSKIKEWSKSKSKEEVIDELYQLSMKYQITLKAYERRIETMEERREEEVKYISLRDYKKGYKECYIKEKEKMEEKVRELELSMSKQLRYCSEQPRYR
jgi:hypothetical protein